LPINPALPAGLPTDGGPTPTPGPPQGTIVLLKPLTLDRPTYGLTDFEWEWIGEPIPAIYGFEVYAWLEGEYQAGVHDAVLDHREGNIERIGDHRYNLRVTNIRYAKGVLGREGNYWWTVALVRVSPDYAPVGLQAPPLRFRYEPIGGE
jgi:hypothetical protein